MHFESYRTVAAVMWLVAGLVTPSIAREREPICLMYLTG